MQQQDQMPPGRRHPTAAADIAEGVVATPQPPPGMAPVGRVEKPRVAGYHVFLNAPAGVQIDVGPELPAAQGGDGTPKPRQAPAAAGRIDSATAGPAAPWRPEFAAGGNK